jgi:hypothetical protein
MLRSRTHAVPSLIRSSHALAFSAACMFAPFALAQTAAQVTSDATKIYYKIPYSGTPTWVRVFIDTDRNAATGYAGYAIGSSFMVENGNLYRYSGSNGGWGWTFVKAVTSTVSNGVANVAVLRADLGSATAIDSVTQTDPPTATSAKLTLNLAAAAPTVKSDTTNVYYQIPYSGTPTWVRVFIDTDRNAATGYAGYTIGSSFLVENGNLYRYSGSNGAWGWTFVKTVSSTASNGTANVTVPRADLGSATAIDSVTQTDPPTATSAKVTLTLATASTPTTSSTTTPTTTVPTTPTAPTTTTPPPTTTTTPPPTTTTPPPTTTTPTTTAPPTTASTGPTYYVSTSGNDSSAGSQSAPWRTIQKAANTLVAGDTAVLLDGTYEEGSINFTHSGTAAKPITIRAQNKWQAILGSTSGCNPGFSIGASYITVKDIRFSTSPRNVQCGIYTSTNVAIRAWNSVEPSPSNPTTGNVGFVADGIKVDGGPARSEGVKSNQDFTIIQNSEFANSMEIFNSKNSIIRNNVVTSQDGYGVSILAKGGVRSAQIYNNVVHNTFKGGYAIYMGGYSCDTCFYDQSAKIEAYNSVAYNNVVINESGGSMYGLVFAGAANSAFFNNVVIGGGVIMMAGGHNAGFQAPTSNPTLQNNIFVCNGATAVSGTSSGTQNFNHNDFTGCSGTPSQAQPVTGDPMFVNQASDWHLKAGSPAMNMGAAASITGYDGVAIDVSHDMNGVVRTAPWDLGIYNY